MRKVPTAIVASSLLIALLQGCASPAEWRTDSKNPPPTVHKVKTMKKSHHRRAASPVPATRSAPSTASNLPDLNIYGRGGGGGSGSGGGGGGGGGSGGGSGGGGGGGSGGGGW